VSTSPLPQLRTQLCFSPRGDAAPISSRDKRKGAARNANRCFTITVPSCSSNFDPSWISRISKQWSHGRCPARRWQTQNSDRSNLRLRSCGVSVAVRECTRTNVAEKPQAQSHSVHGWLIRDRPRRPESSEPPNATQHSIAGGRIHFTRAYAPQGFANQSRHNPFSKQADFRFHQPGS